MCLKRKARSRRAKLARGSADRGPCAARASRLVRHRRRDAGAESSTTAPRWKTSPSIAPRSSAARSLGLEPVETRAEQRVQARRQRERSRSPRRCRHRPRGEYALLDEHRHELLGKERVPGRMRCASRVAHQRPAPARAAREQRVGVVRAERLEPNRRPPSRDGSRAAPAATGQSTRTGASATAAGRPASRSSSAGSAHWMSSTSTTSGRARGPADRKRAIAHGGLLGGRRRPRQARAAARSWPRRRARSPPRRHVPRSAAAPARRSPRHGSPRARARSGRSPSR